MKKKLTLSVSAMLLVLLCLFIYSCQEDFDKTNATTTVAVPDDLLNAAKEWHSQNTQGNNNSRLSNYKNKALQPIWENATLNVLKNAKTQLIVPSIEIPLGAKSTVGVLRKFVFNYDNGRITNGRIVEIYGDSRYVDDHRKHLLENYEKGDLNDFTGSVILYDVNYGYLISFNYKNGRMIPGLSMVSPESQLPSDKMGEASSQRTSYCDNYFIVTYIWDDNSYQWVAESWRYLYSVCVCDNNEYGGCGGSSGGTSTAIPLVLAPSGGLISNIAAYLNCFDTNSSASITIYVDQPIPDTRNTWGGSIFDPFVGHTFVSITQGGITRVFGFYPGPGQSVNPLTQPSVSSALYDDGSHSYDVSITTTINSIELTNIINIANNYNGTYDLNTYNCTDFGMSIAAAAGLSLPDTNGTWPGGSGSNPGDFGQDVRSYSPPSGASINSSGGSALSNSGTCNE